MKPNSHEDGTELSPEEFDDDWEEEDRERECSNSCSHFDSLNQCCWQATEKGLCFHVSEGDLCHLGYMENDGK